MITTTPNDKQMRRTAKSFILSNSPVDKENDLAFSQENSFRWGFSTGLFL